MTGRASFAEQVYTRLITLALPASFRREAAGELLEVFRDGERAAAARGAAAHAAFYLRVIADLAITAYAERRGQGPTHESNAPRIGHLRLDLNASLRELRRSPVATAAAIVTLGLGIGAAVLLLVLVRGVLNDPLEFHQPQRLVRLLEESDEGRTFWPSFPNITDWRDQATAFQAVIAADIGAVQPVIVDAAAERATIGRVSRDFFRVLGIAPAAGRDLRPDENRPGGPAVALVSEEFWRSRLGARPIDDLRLELATDHYQVVGVIPRGFRFLAWGNEWRGADIWLPLERNSDLGGRTSHGYQAVARLADGTSLDAARPSLNTLASNLARAYGGATDADRIIIMPLSEAVVGNARRPLHILLAAAITLLAVACLNLGAGLLARGITRHRDLAVRAALGARRADLLRLHLVFAGLLGLPAAGAGIVIAYGGLEAIRAWAGSAIPRLENAALDPAAIASAATIALLTALAAGLIPAFTLSGRTDIATRIRTHGSTGDGPGQQLLWDTFVAGQVALTLALLVTSALLTRSLMAALDTDPGYATDGVAIAEITLPESRYADMDRRIAYYDVLLDRLRARPGITAAGLVSIPPDEIFTFTSGSTRRIGDDDQSSTWAGFRLADPGYFETVGIPVFNGALDRSSNAVLVDRTLASTLWSDSPARGRITSSFIADTVDVAGVTGAVRAWHAPDVAMGATYMHFAHRPEQLLRMFAVARGYDMAATADAIRESAMATDPLAPVDVQTLRARIDHSMASRRLTLAIAAGFAIAALFLAAAGIYSLIAQSAERRRRETGIRIILGARPARVRRQVLALGLRATTAGILVGAAISWVGVRLIRSQLFGVSGFDPAALAAAAGLLLAAAGLAAWIPAHRATRVDPVRLLRD